MAVIKTGHNPSANSGSGGFVDGESVTRANLNTHVNSATFIAGNSGTTDNDTLEVHTDGKLRVKDSSSTSTGITFPKMRHIGNNEFLGRTSSGEGDIEAVNISAIANLLRPKFVPATTTGSTALEQTVTTGTGTSTFTYNVSEFDSNDSDFGSYKQIVAIHVDCYAQSRGNLQQVTVTYPNGATAFMVAAAEYQSSSAIATGNQSESNTAIPINKDQSTVVIKHVRNYSGAEDDTFHKITGFTIIPNLPTS